MRNHFGSLDAAERYARGRPFFHPLVVERIQRILALPAQLPRALDVGCGTGQSSVAIAPIAKEIVGVDISAAMLAVAERHPQVRYVESTAEELPFEDGTFDLFTVGLAVHWFDRGRFLVEARRVLKPGGWLAVYADGFEGEMSGNPAYTVWNRNQYVKRFPTPPRHSSGLLDDEALQYGFVRVAGETFRHSVTFTPEKLVAYLSTQTNVTAAIDDGGETAEGACSWLLDAVSPMFAAYSAEFSFCCVLEVFSRDSK